MQKQNWSLNSIKKILCDFKKRRRPEEEGKCLCAIVRKAEPDSPFDPVMSPQFKLSDGKGGK